MDTPTRLFDIPYVQMHKYALPDMLSAKEEGQWRGYSTAQVIETTQKLAAGLMALGLSANDFSPEKADKVAILCANRPEWIMLDLACQHIGVVLCPIYPTTHPNELLFILTEAQIKYVFVGEENLLEKVRSIAPKCEALEGIYTFDKIAGADHWQQVLKMSTGELIRRVQQISRSISPSSLATIIYTSGTTGTPKGVMLSHHNIVSNVLHSKQSFPFEDSPGQKVLSFLPLNHIFERMVTYIYMLSGNSIYYAEGLETIGDNLKEVKPVGFTTVPRLLEKVYDTFESTGNKLEGVKRKLFNWALQLGFKYDNLQSGGLLYNVQLAISRKLVFSKLKEGLGGNIQFIITGGAACQQRLLRLFNAGGIPVYEGYGPTENSPVITVNRRSPGMSKYGTVGVPITGQEVKLAEDGEIMVKGPSVMQGYYKRPDLTAETIHDGWLLTGDIGVWEDNKFLRITDRKKELFKTSGGKYVAPQPIENKLKESSLVEQVMVVGAERKFVGALIVPSMHNLREWMRHNGLQFVSPEQAIREPKVLALYRELVEAFNKFFNQVEQIKKFELLPEEWTISSGELTPTLKLKRKVVMEKYRDAVERIYS
jgi:long-chain acyl-CoA synthetase